MSIIIDTYKLTEAVEEWNRSNDLNTEPIHLGRLMFNTESGEIWTDTYYDLKNIKWKIYESQSIVNLGWMLIEADSPEHNKGKYPFTTGHFSDSNNKYHPESVIRFLYEYYDNNFLFTSNDILVTVTEEYVTGDGNDILSSKVVDEIYDPGISAADYKKLTDEDEIGKFFNLIGGRKNFEEFYFKNRIDGKRECYKESLNLTVTDADSQSMDDDEDIGDMVRYLIDVKQYADVYGGEGKGTEILIDSFYVNDSDFFEQMFIMESPGLDVPEKRPKR